MEMAGMSLLCLYALVVTLYGWLKREPPEGRFYMSQENAAVHAERDVEVYARMIQFALEQHRARELHITLPFTMLHALFSRYPDLRYHVLGVVGDDTQVIVLLPAGGAQRA